MAIRLNFLTIAAILIAAGCAQSGAERGKTAAEEALSVAAKARAGDQVWLEARALAEEAIEADSEQSVSMAGVIGRSYVLGPDNAVRAAEAEPYLIKGLPGDNRLHWLLAKGYDNGWYGEVDKVRACEHYVVASAEANIKGSYWPTALCFLNGTGVDTDETAAFEWLTKSANAGDQNGMISLAVLYATGQGTEKDLNQAATWYETAVRTKGPNRAHALRGLGAMHLFELEDGIKQRGYALLELAGEEGDATAGRLLSNVQALDEAQRKAVDVQKSFLVNFFNLDDDELTDG